MRVVLLADQALQHPGKLTPYWQLAVVVQKTYLYGEGTRLVLLGRPPGVQESKRLCLLESFQMRPLATG